jgi:hypothetical protein
MPQVAVLDLRTADPERLAAISAERLPERVSGLFDRAKARYTKPGMIIGDALSRFWLKRSENERLSEIDAAAKIIGRSGAHLLNASYDWACTSAACAADEENAPLFVRILDWDLAGLGENLCALIQRGPAGDWINLSWPGYAGCVTGVAFARFAVAINQPPRPDCGIAGGTRFAKAANWIAARPATWRSKAPPAPHLLRKTFEQASDYDEAVAALSETEICGEAFFIVNGPNPGQACVIERRGKLSEIRRADENGIAACSNHWIEMKLGGVPRGRDSAERLESMRRMDRNDLRRREGDQTFDWMRDPILNEGTRVAVIADLRSGTLRAAGFENGKRVTEVLSLTERDLLA